VTVARPVRELKGFVKVSLPAGSSRRVSIELDQRAFAFWSVQHGRWAVEAGDFEIGPSRRHSFDLAAFQAARQPATVTPSTLGQLAHTFACGRSVRRASDRPNAAVGRLFVEARLATRQ